jgi:hypothetical protein
MTVQQFCGVCLLTVSLAACHGEPVLDPGDRPPNIRGTISGMVRTPAGEPLSARKVTAVDTTSGARYEQSTAANGGYTVQVPTGTYRLELEVRAGERVATQPEPTEVNIGDLDGQRDFVVTTASAAR